jgi:hypothetical protein
MATKRISQSATITLHAPPEKVFPLFGAIEEKKWADGWDPEILYSRSGGMEKHMIFRTTPAFPGEAGYLWIVSACDPETTTVEYLVSTDHRLWTISVVCREHHSGGTEATVTYTYTGFSDAGNKRNEDAMKLMFAHNLRDWEDAINYYLREGKRIPPSHLH